MPTSLRAFAILLPVALAAAGCKTTEDGFVAKNWQNNMRELGVYPIFPPREDFAVGDVYLSSEGDLNCPSGFLQVGAHLAYVDLTTDLKSHYAKRPEFPPTSSGQQGYFNWAFATSQTGAPPPITQPKSTGDVFATPNATNRLKLVSFPDFASASFTGANLSALIPTEIPILAGLGVTSESIEMVTFRVPLAESYGLPTPQVLSKTLTDTAVTDALQRDRLSWYVPADPCPSAVSRRTKNLNSQIPNVVLTVVSEVFLARALDVSISLNSKFGAELKAALANPAAGSGMEKMLAQYKQALGSPPPAPTPTSPGGTISDIAAEARTQATRNASVSTPGVTASLVRADTGAITMRRTYEQPIAIGFRGAFLTVGYDSAGKPTFAGATIPSTNNATLSVPVKLKLE